MRPTKYTSLCGAPGIQHKHTSPLFPLPLHILNFLCALPARTYLGHFWQHIHQHMGQILQVPGVWRSSCNRRCPLATCRTSPHVWLEQGRSRDQCHLHSWAPRPPHPPARPVPCHGCLATGCSPLSSASPGTIITGAWRAGILEPFIRHRDLLKKY